MSRLVCYLIITLASVATANAQLPTEASEALRQWDSKFEVFAKKDFAPEVQRLFSSEESTPAILVEDLNGDKVQDYVVLGTRGPEQQAAVALLSSKEKKFEALPVEEYDLPRQRELPIYLKLGSGKGAERYQRLHSRPVIKIETYGGTASLYAIEKAKVVKVKAR